MPIDINVETSLAVAEKLLEQEHIINIKRIEVLSQLVIKVIEHSPELKNEVENEIKMLEKLEKKMEQLEDASRGFLTACDFTNGSF